jgi:hypothetical protein
MPGQFPNSIHKLEKASQYKVRRNFVDIHFLPYHGGYTIVFKERNLYLQEQENVNILDSFGDYFSLVTG